MSARRLSLDVRTLRTRVARRFFAAFLACSLLPVAGFAVYGYLQVRAQLESDAYASLGRDVKSAGMSILERLMLVEIGLRAVPAHHLRPAEPPPGVLRLRVESLDAARARISPAVSSRLAEGLTALHIATAASPVRVEMLRPQRNGVLVAELDPHFLFVPDRVQSEERYWVEGPDGTLLFAVPDDAETRALPGAHRDSRRHFEATLGRGRELGTVWPLFLGSPFEAGEWRVGMSRTAERVLYPLEDFERVFPVFAGVTVALAIVASIGQIRRTLVPLDALTGFAGAIGGGDLEARVDVASRDEFEDLATAFNDMAAQLRRHVAALRRLNAIGRALSSERSVESFLDLALEGAAQLTGADAGALLLGDEDEGFEVARIRFGGRSGSAGDFAQHIPVAAPRRAAVEGRTILTERGQLTDDEALVWGELERRTGLALTSCLSVPLRSEQGEPLGALVLLSGAPASSGFPAETIDLAESLSSQAAIAIRQARHLESLRGLFEGLIQLTVRAIDEKSAYTGEHCRKVPILTELIADAACRAKDGPLKDFDLSDEQRYELRIAALLHDCGKVVTPVHVMDKATKLETIFDRIELLRTRFELVRRDVENRALALRLERAGLALGDAEAAAVQREREQLADDLAFLERVNRGGESMSREDQRRVDEIGTGRRWRDADDVEHPLLREDEIRNLKVPRGTLNPEEREIMDQHVVSTIRLLEELPFPKELRNVPAIAGAHHERVDGRGYPLGLSGERLTMQGRILGLADVFEALTAKTRPYKPGMTLSETLAILERMAREGHIDPRLHEIFVREKVYLDYAVAQLDPEQIDAAHQADLEEHTGPWRDGSPRGDGASSG